MSELRYAKINNTVSKVLHQGRRGEKMNGVVSHKICDKVWMLALPKKRLTLLVCLVTSGTVLDT